MSTPSVDITEVETIPEFDANQLAPFSLWSADFYAEKNMDWVNIPQSPSSRSWKSASLENSSETAKKSSDNIETKQWLACLNCRAKKIKCQRPNNSSDCRRCTKFKLRCVVPDGDERRKPSSKTYIRELELKISTLERQLKQSKEETSLAIQASQASKAVDSTILDMCNDSHEITATSSKDKSTVSTIIADIPQNLITRLCTRQPQLQSDETGQLRFFGTTSSLHTAESTSSSFVQWGDFTSKSDSLVHNEIPTSLQESLLERYWKYQHTVLQVIHREAFLHDMNTGQCRYYSKALLYSIFACAARISENEKIRALAFSKEDSTDDPPYLLKRAIDLTQEELDINPGITTIQSLQLLSVIHCTRSADTKGWMESGLAIRLMFELGLHRGQEDLGSSHLSQLDLEVRQVVFWGCFTLDRMWSLYLGRPCSVKMEDVRVPRPGTDSNMPSWEMLMLEAWTSLLDIVGQISDSLNVNQCADGRIEILNQQLLSWEIQLNPQLKYTPDCRPSISMLHLQYCCTMILLHRATARFGTDISRATSESLHSRDICITQATRAAHMLVDYRKNSGNACTMLGTALYNITIVAVVLVAAQADNVSILNSEHLECVDMCLEALEELENSYIVARTVLKQIKYLIRRCKLPYHKLKRRARRDTESSMMSLDLPNEGESPPLNLEGKMLPLIPGGDALGDPSSEDFLLAMEDCDALHSIVSWSVANNISI